MTSPNPDWRDLFMGQVDVEMAKRRWPKRPHRDFKARIQLSAAPAVTSAAANRGMSTSAYIRRAALAFAAFDLGIDLDQMLSDEPATRLKSEGPKTNRLEGGEGHGNWRIEGLS
jgi:hypothetical protein